MKYYYDVKHVLLNIDEGDLVFLRLYKGYYIPSLNNTKLLN